MTENPTSRNSGTSLSPGGVRQSKEPAWVEHPPLPAPPSPLRPPLAQRQCRGTSLCHWKQYRPGRARRPACPDGKREGGGARGVASDWEGRALCLAYWHAFDLTCARTAEKPCMNSFGNAPGKSTCRSKGVDGQASPAKRRPGTHLGFTNYENLRFLISHYIPLRSIRSRCNPRTHTIPSLSESPQTR